METIGIEVVVVQVQFPVIGPEQVVQAVQEALLLLLLTEEKKKTEEEEEKEKGAAVGSLKLCVFSHITSMVSLQQ